MSTTVLTAIFLWLLVRRDLKCGLGFGARKI